VAFFSPADSRKNKMYALAMSELAGCFSNPSFQDFPRHGIQSQLHERITSVYSSDIAVNCWHFGDALKSDEDFDEVTPQVEILLVVFQRLVVQRFDSVQKIQNLAVGSSLGTSAAKYTRFASIPCTLL
jgi:hypothetical protein